MKSELVKNKQYSREEIHQHLSRGGNFTTGSGTWGIHGVVRIEPDKNDFVLMSTLGAEWDDYKFNTTIDENGIINWQSQPKQTFKDKMIQDLISHDYNKNNVYLFYRIDKNEDYYYLGKLKYLSNGKEEAPVHFKWQILDFDALFFDYNTNKPVTREEYIDDKLVIRKRPGIIEKKVSGSEVKKKFKKKTDWTEKHEADSILGEFGEELVVEYEIDKLVNNGQTELSKKVRHVSHIDGDGLGYDIVSYDENSQKILIEVKTTKYDRNTSFYMSSNEFKVAGENKEKYFVYRVYREKGKNVFYKLSYNQLIKLYSEPIQFRIIPTNIKD